MPLDDNVVPPHPEITPSVTMPLLKRLLPEDIVRLSAGASIIVVIPPTLRTTTPFVRSRRALYSTLFDHVIEKSYSWMKTDSERARIVDECRLSHHVQREGEKALEYRVRVTNYAERGLFDMDDPDKTQINLVWNQGAGINVVICGYSRRYSVLLQLRDIGLMEIHRLTSPVGDGVEFNRSCLNSRITFPKTTRPENLMGSFLALIENVRGCRISTIEVLWKYYRAEGQATQRQSYLQATTAPSLSVSTSSSSSTPSELGGVTVSHFREIRNELTYSNVMAFSSMVDNLYRGGFERHYSTFTHLQDYIVVRNDFLVLYDKFVELFPHIHAVFALTVSSHRSRGARVALSASFDGMTCYSSGDRNSFGIENEALDDSDSSEDKNYDNNGDDGDDSDAGVEKEDYILLGKKERAILEFFLAMIRQIQPQILFQF
jgi:hypothetical protein